MRYAMVAERESFFTMINKCESTKRCIKVELCASVCELSIRSEESGDLWGNKWCFSVISTNVSIKMSHSI